MMEVSEKIVCLLTYIVVNVIVAKCFKSLISETTRLIFVKYLYLIHFFADALFYFGVGNSTDFSLPFSPKVTK